MSDKGLEGIVATTTDLSLVDGIAGHLIYRGYAIGDLAAHATFEETASLLWHGDLPTPDERQTFQAAMAAQRTLPERVITLIQAHPAEADPMDVLRTAVSALGSLDDFRSPPNIQQAMRLTAAFPSILATYHRHRLGLPILAPRSDLSHTANYLYMLSGVAPSPAQVRALDTYLVLTADHGMNASTFTARIMASTLSDMVSSVTGAIGALKGPLHGGAPFKVAEMLEAIGTPANAEPWLRNELDHHHRIMGFGHRVYKTLDPRSVALSALADQLVGAQDAEWLALARHVETLTLRLLKAYKHDHPLYTNVEFYAAPVFRRVKIHK
jgi:citrate synthase